MRRAEGCPGEHAQSKVGQPSWRSCGLATERRLLRPRALPGECSTAVLAATEAWKRRASLSRGGQGSPAVCTGGRAQQGRESPAGPQRTPPSRRWSLIAMFDLVVSRAGDRLNARRRVLGGRKGREDSN
eukprot:scaffold2067_cov379-Prasinococcus_capsulatus_cf.AAC.2